MSGFGFSLATHYLVGDIQVTTSAKNTRLSEPVGDKKVPATTFAYFETRNKYRAYDLVMQAFEDSGLSQAGLSRRMGLGPDQVNRYLRSPANWTLDTFANLLFAICGGQPHYTVEYPLRAPMRNDTHPDWLKRSIDIKPSKTEPTSGTIDLPRAIERPKPRVSVS